MSVNANKLVQIVPRVIDAGTAGLTFSGLLLTQSTLPPAGRVLQFSSAQAVADYFGSASTEAALAAQYFAGYVNAAYLPGTLFFAPWNQNAVAAWLRGAAFSGTLASLKTILDGSITVNVDGVDRVGTGIDLSMATSLSAVAQAIQTALASTQQPATAGALDGGTVTTGLAALATVTSGSLDIDVDSSTKNLTDLNFSAVQSLTDVASVLQTAFSGAATVAVNAAGTGLVITSATTGAGSSVGYATDASPSGSVADLAAALGLTQATGATQVAGADSQSLTGPAVTYDSQTQAFQFTSPTTGSASSVGYAATGGSGTDLSAVLGLTEQAGAVLSPGLDGMTLTDTMTGVLNYARDWVTFSTVFEPVLDEKLELAQWCAGYDTRFVYILWDTDNAAQVQGSTASAGYIINRQLELDGTCCVYNSAQLAAAVMGAVACVNFDQREGRTTLAFRQFEGVTVTCDNDEDYDALLDNGYNCYADFATASAQFKFFQNGQVSGKFDWLDTYINAIGLKDALQLNILDLFAAVRSLPYNEDGYASVRTACLDTINRFVTFGAIRAGVTLSQTQKVQLLAEIGQDVSQTLESVGWYMQVTDPGAVVRGQRGTPNCAFYYMDGGSIQKIVMSATAIQ